MNKQKNSKSRAYFYIFAAVVLLITSLGILRWHVNEQSYRANLKKTGVKITALVATRSEIQYPTPEGIVTVKPIVSPAKGTLKRFTEVTAYYDKNNVRKAVIDQDDSAFNITMYIVITKLFVVGMLFLYFGLKKFKKFAIS